MTSATQRVKAVARTKEVAAIKDVIAGMKKLGFKVRDVEKPFGNYGPDTYAHIEFIFVSQVCSIWLILALEGNRTTITEDLTEARAPRFIKDLEKFAESYQALAEAYTKGKAYLSKFVGKTPIREDEEDPDSMPGKLRFQ